MKTPLMAPVAAGTGTVRSGSCDQAGTLISKTDPRQIESKIRMTTECGYGTMIVSPG
jgi:hypothetical protein